jgi:hypothetical protein
MEICQIKSKYIRKEADGYKLSNISAPDNHRYFQKLQETEVAANMAFDYKFSKEVKENTTENLQLDIAVV